jgi:hypothetical protein
LAAGVSGGSAPFAAGVPAGSAPFAAGRFTVPMGIRCGLAVSVAVLLLAGCAHISRAPAAESPDPPECAAAADEIPHDGIGTRDGQLVPPGADTALFCTYNIPRDSSDQWPLTTQIESIEPAAKLAEYLNNLRPSRFADQRVCNMMLGPRRTIVLGYPDGGSATVAIDENCGILSRDHVARDVDGSRRLMAFFGR